MECLHNRPFPNYRLPLFESESWCSPFMRKLVFIHMQMTTNFHMAPGLALKNRQTVLRKWPIAFFLWGFTGPMKQTTKMNLRGNSLSSSAKAQAYMLLSSTIYIRYIDDASEYYTTGRIYSRE